METLYYSKMNSPFGPLIVGVSHRGLVLLEFDRGNFPPLENGKRPQISWHESAEETREYVHEVKEYFAGERREFTIPLDLRGTAFQKRCWKALLSIPYGETRSYGDIAKIVGKPRASRAVGGANHRNNMCIVIPCHRVLASDGTLGGYGGPGGLKLKRKLLELEGVHVTSAGVIKRAPRKAAGHAA
jgi:O-6-methylguanine DNA methyltransferase